jgi:hypothetical protein
MFRLIGRRLTRSPYAKAVPLVPLISSGSSSAVQSAGDAGVEAEPPDPDHHSPLTYGKVFTAIPRVTGVNTPNINSRIAEKWGLPFVKNSGAFRKSYIDGRETLRYVCIPLK